MQPWVESWDGEREERWKTGKEGKQWLATSRGSDQWLVTCGQWGRSEDMEGRMDEREPGRRGKRLSVRSEENRKRGRLEGEKTGRREYRWLAV